MSKDKVAGLQGSGELLSKTVMTRRFYRSSNPKSMVISGYVFFIFEPAAITINYCHSSRCYFLKQLRVGEFSQSSLRQFSQFFEELLVNRLEVEARLALHSFLQFRRDVLEQIPTSVDRHQMKTHVGLAQAYRGEAQPLLV